MPQQTDAARINLAAAALLAALAAPAAAARPGHPICMREPDITSTEIPNDSTILFHLRDGSIVRSRLTVPCVGLANAPGGITSDAFDPGSGDLCDDLASFTVNLGASISSHGGRVCTFGPFDLLAGPTHAGAAHAGPVHADNAR